MPNDHSVSAEKARLTEVLAAHRFVPTRSEDGTLDYGWCAGGDSYRTKHISEHEAHVLDVAFPPATPEVRDAD